MQFKEGDADWIDVPEWARFLIEFGYNWNSGASAPRKRRIALISMPCPSPAAGLVALGLLRERMERAGANDLWRHYERICKLALKADTSAQLVHRLSKGKRYVASRVDSDGVWVEQVGARPSRAIKATASGPVSRTIKASTAAEWHFVQEPEMETRVGEQIPYGEIYERLIPTGRKPLAENLSRSDSTICLTTEVLGESSAQRKYISTLFGDPHNNVSLAELLTVHAWSSARTSRLLLWNARLGKMDRPGQPNVVVVDGDACLQRIISEEEFESVDLVCVFHRLTGRSALEALGAKLEELRQWYGELVSTTSNVPHGVSTLTLSRL